MTPTELEMRIRALERMSFRLRRFAATDQVDVEDLEVRIAGNRPGPNPGGGGLPVVTCGGTCPWPTKDMTWTRLVDSARVEVFTATTYQVAQWFNYQSVSRPVYFRANTVSISPNGGTFGPYWYTDGYPTDRATDVVFPDFAGGPAVQSIANLIVGLPFLRHIFGCRNGTFSMVTLGAFTQTQIDGALTLRTAPLGDVAVGAIATGFAQTTAVLRTPASTGYQFIDPAPTDPNTVLTNSISAQCSPVKSVGGMNINRATGVGTLYYGSWGRGVMVEDI